VNPTPGLLQSIERHREARRIRKGIESFRFLRVFSNRPKTGTNTGLGAAVDAWFLGTSQKQARKMNRMPERDFSDFRIP